MTTYGAPAPMFNGGSSTDPLMNALFPTSVNVQRVGSMPGINPIQMTTGYSPQMAALYNKAPGINNHNNPMNFGTNNYNNASQPGFFGPSQNDMFGHMDRLMHVLQSAGIPPQLMQNIQQLFQQHFGGNGGGGNGGQGGQPSFFQPQTRPAMPMNGGGPATPEGAPGFGGGFNPTARPPIYNNPMYGAPVITDGRGFSTPMPPELMPNSNSPANPIPFGTMFRQNDPSQYWQHVNPNGGGTFMSRPTMGPDDRSHLSFAPAMGPSSLRSNEQIQNLQRSLGV